ncbi:hypothetical protein GCM10010218_17930 [Streptomyces mashuensis]|uniref:Uncharacterized protein n=1 Tax=Streptomyces mashuensis TaxID=33904 RepID=A0A919EC08_9ACTN|nr:DUF6412 domain-containing protein [Streptomyces mashuensis]GHF36790.1 hypothetical protein GCM10010218_17930 [Streptomyces mashuensis]
MSAAQAVRTQLSVLFVVLAELFLAQSGMLAAATAVTAVAATTVVATAVLLLSALATAAAPAGPLTPTRIRTAIRDRELRTAFLAQRDPDARGRRRPRAPGRALPATA